MLEQARQAANQRSALRLGDLSEEERQQIEAEADVLAPYRNIVLALGAGALFPAFYDTLLLVARGPRLLPRMKGNMDEFNSDSIVLILFLALLGAICIYAGLVWMAPPPLPTVKELMDDIEERAEEPSLGPAAAPPSGAAEGGERSAEGEAPLGTSSPALVKMLLGTWCYGAGRRQTFTLSKAEQQPWRFDERLDGRAYSADLYPKAGWLQGDLMDEEGAVAGEIRFQPGREGFVVSNFRLPGEDKWSIKNKAYRAGAEKKEEED